MAPKIMKKNKLIESAIINCLFNFSDSINRDVLIKNLSIFYHLSSKQIENCIKNLEKKEIISGNSQGNLCLVSYIKKS